MLRLASKDMGALLRVEPPNWAAINRRVEVVLRAEAIRWIVTRSLPAYPVLLEHCLKWPSTFNGILGLSDAIADYAGGAVGDFFDLRQQVQQATAGGGRVPEVLVTLARFRMSALRAQTASISTHFGLVGKELGAFLQANHEVDEQLARNDGGLGWEKVREEAQRVEAALGLAVGQWRAVDDDLREALSLPVDAVLPLLELAELSAAITVWQNLRNECRTFSRSMEPEAARWNRPRTTFQFLTDEQG